METEIKVSIIVNTYNHEKFIADTLNGIVIQKVNFPFEVLIHDDASNDNTVEIIKDYISKYHHINFKPIFQTVNQYSQNIKIGQTFQYPRVKGKYIAICEGDDYWTDPLKLQKQVDFLEENPEYSFCFHNAMVLKQSTGEEYLFIRNREIDEIVDLKSVIIKHNASTASLLFRKNSKPDTLPSWFYKTSKGDYALVILLAKQGLGKYLPEAMSVYRIHTGGVWSSKSRILNIEENIKFYDLITNYFNSAVIKKTIRLKKNKEFQNKALIQIRQGSLIIGLYNLLSHWNFTSDKRLKTSIHKIANAILTGLKHF